MEAFPLLADPVPAAAPEASLPHPALWRAHELGRERVGVCATGFDALDVELPGGGWPKRALTELLLAHVGIGELRLLAPVLAALQQAQRHVLLVDPPAPLSAWGWCGLGLDAAQLVVVQRRPDDRTARGPLRRRLPAADMWWAAEQALACGHVGALLLWLPARLPADLLRRLQLAAQAHDGPAFLLRDAQARGTTSAAPLRVWLQPAGADRLQLRVVKRRGPPLVQPIVLDLAPTLPTSVYPRADARLAEHRPARPAGETAAPAARTTAPHAPAVAGAA
ncbi:MAG: translesion DNA synthesis-associated protein ImuA [Rubrivivax sp.]|nr:translesion DNA synthesis-associated protein ImuA [Rubrivivax sp.]